MRIRKTPLRAVGLISLLATVGTLITLLATNAGAANFTGEAQITPGTLSVTFTGGFAVTFPVVTLNGTNQTAVDTTDDTYDVSDFTGSGAGWNITAVATPFCSILIDVGSCSGGDTASGLTITAGGDSAGQANTAPGASCVGGTCSAPTNTAITYPVTVPYSGGNPILEADVGHGMGENAITSYWGLNVAANATVAATTDYSQITVAANTGP